MLHWISTKYWQLCDLLGASQVTRTTDKKIYESFLADLEASRLYDKPAKVAGLSTSPKEQKRHLYLVKPS